LISRIIIDTIRHLSADGKCVCRELRKETLLKGIYNK
jgi:5'-methylthioadenosine phosphorylase